jgi:dipeptidyl aminopeptidase/acylaminoacyl peptidase
MNIRFVAALLLASVSSAAAAAAPPSIEAFADHTGFGLARLSPDGRHLAIERTQDNGNSLVIVRTDTLEPTAELAFAPHEYVYGMDWANAGTLVVSRAIRIGGLETPRLTGELFAIPVNGGRARHIAGGQGDRPKTGDLPVAFIVDVLARDDDAILVSSTDFPKGRDDEPRPRLVKVSLGGNSREEIAVAPMAMASFVTDREGRLAFVQGSDEDFRPVAFRYLAAEKRFEPIVAGPGPDASFVVLGFSADSATAYAAISERGETPCLYSVDMASLSRQRLECDPESEPVALQDSHVTGEPLGVVFASGKPRLHLLAPRSPQAAFHESLSQAHAPSVVTLLDTSRDGKLTLYAVWGDREPGRVYLYDHATQRSRGVFESAASLDRGSLSPMVPMPLAARDGTVLRAFLTVPAGGAMKDLPLVVMPHGGPHGVRDAWDFRPEVQLLASRGYAVLQVNFRGSGGRGQAFTRLGYRQWSGAMQDDIADATRQLVGAGVVDPKRVCIAGASFGAYSAMISSIRYPDLYRCAVGYAGVYRLERLFRSGDTGDSDRSRRYFDLVIGRDPAELDRDSPASRAAELRQPVLLVHGQADWRTPPEHAEALRKALAKSGNPPEWLMVPREGHGFVRKPNRVAYYRALLAFLDRHIGPAPAPQAP